MHQHQTGRRRSASCAGGRSDRGKGPRRVHGDRCSQHRNRKAQIYEAKGTEVVLKCHTLVDTPVFHFLPTLLAVPLVTWRGADDELDIRGGRQVSTSGDPPARSEET